LSGSQNWKTPLIVESHINGLRNKSHSPHLPVFYDEIAADAIACWEAGACAVHLHNTNIVLNKEEAYDDYIKSVQPALDKYPDMFWYSTNTAILPGMEDITGVEHVEFLAQRNGVRLCCIDCGSANLPIATDENGNIIGITYSVPFDTINKQVDACFRSNLGIVWGVYEPGYLRTALQYIKMGRSTPGSSIDLYFQGDYGTSSMQPINTCGLPPTVESLDFYLNMMEGCTLPWFISIWGEGSADTRPILKRAIELGGHIKTGLELHYDPDSNPTNVQLLQQVQELAKEIGRPLATQKEAQKILGLS
jgi:uncharacterized protein (DUF849 family)